MATNGDDPIFFDGVLGQLNVTLVNPYSGATIVVNDMKNINRAVYDGLGGNDTLFMTNIGDALFIRDNLNHQVVANVETYIAGDGGDVIQLADSSFILGNTSIFGGEGDDILWANIGNDFISGAGGDDIIDGGPGNDTLLGEDDNDTLSGGDGNDTLDGGNGNDVLAGGTGADNYVSGLGNDVIHEAADGSHDIITLPTGITLANITFADPGNDLTIAVGALGTITITGQYDSPTSGIDELVFSNGTHFDLRTLFHNYAPVAQDDNFTVNEDNVLTGNVLLNNGHGVDTDQNGDVLTVTAGTFATAHGSVVLAADGNFTYTPAANYFGSDSFSYTLLDTHGANDTGLVSITINSVNDTPVAVDDNASTNEDTAVNGNVLVNDSDIDGGILSVTPAIIATAHGSVVLSANGDFTYTPAANYFGADSFDYTLSDGQGGTDIGTVHIGINSVNDAPVAVDDAVSTNEDTAVVGNVLTNDSDIDGGILSVIAGTIATAHGSVVLAADGSFTYIATANYFGSDSFDYTLSDGQGGNDVGTVNIAINSVNDAPVAVADTATTNEDTAVVGNVLVNDSDIDGGVLSVVAATINTAHGTVDLLANGDFTYTPAANYFGADTFDYTLSDGQGGTDIGTVNLTIASVNDAPVAVDDSATTNEDTVVTGNVLVNDSDIDGGILSVVAATIATAHGSVDLLANGDFTYTPVANYFGTDSFDYTLSDGQGGTDVGTVNLTINSVNDGPVAVDDVATTNEDTAVAGNVLVNDSDIDGGVLSVIAATINTAHGTVDLLANGDFTYTPVANYFGTDSFDYTLSDGQGGTDVGTVNLTINSVNDGPVAVDDVATTNEDTAVAGNVLVNDSDIDGGVLSVIAATIATAHGNVVLSANGDFTYTPAANYFGADSFSYTLLDGQGGNDTATVNIIINSVNDGPVAVNDVATTNEDTPVVRNVLVNDSDIDGGVLSVVAASFNTSHGTVNLLANGDFTYTPAANYFGSDSFNYTLLDNQGGNAIGTVNLTISSVNDGPVAKADDFTGNENHNVTGNLLANNGHGVDSDIDGGVLSVTAQTFTTANGGAVVVAANGDFTYTPASHYFGADSFSYTLLDGQGGNATALVSLTITTDATLGTNNNDTIHGTTGNDHIHGLDGNDTIYGGLGNDVIVGGNGNDTLYGGDNTTTITTDKQFLNDGVLFPNVSEAVSIHNLLPPGDPAVGIHDDNLNVGTSIQAVITRQDSAAGYNSSLGYFSVNSSGEMIASTMIWSAVNNTAVGSTKTVDVSAGGTNSEIGFFIISNGNNTNNSYSGLNITGTNVLHFIYDYGTSHARAATVNDFGSHISLVYDDGHTSRVLQGDVYFSTDRGGSANLNDDHATHVISGEIAAHNTDVLRIGFEDLPCLGDADYQDVVFDVNFKPVTLNITDTGNDTLIGGAGNDTLYGEGGNDILVVGLGADNIYGGTGNDQIVYDKMDSNVDTIHGFETGAGHDVLNITDILEGYDASDNINNFVQLFNNAATHQTEVKVNADGDVGGAFTTIATFDTIVTDTLTAMIANGNIVANQHVTV